MNEADSDILADRLADSFHRWLDKRYPQYVWVRRRGVREWPPTELPTNPAGTDPAPAGSHARRERRCPDGRQ